MGQPHVALNVRSDCCAALRCILRCFAFVSMKYAENHRKLNGAKAPTYWFETMSANASCLRINARRPNLQNIVWLSKLWDKIILSFRRVTSKVVTSLNYCVLVVSSNPCLGGFRIFSRKIFSGYRGVNKLVPALFLWAHVKSAVPRICTLHNSNQEYTFRGR